MKPLEILQGALVATFVFPPLMIITLPALLVSRNWDPEVEEEYTEEEWNPTI